MDECCEEAPCCDASTYYHSDGDYLNRIDKDLVLARTFAVIGLLRSVTERAPVDMILMYIKNTDCIVDGNWWSRRSAETRSVDTGEQLSIKHAEHVERDLSFPPGIVRMAKEYMVRRFWKNIDTIRGTTRYFRTYDRGSRSRDGYEVCVCRRLPTVFLDALTSIHLTPNQTLWDAKGAIDVLHAACIPSNLDRPDWLERNGDRDGSKFGTVTTKHTNKINILENIITSYVWSNETGTKIPNEAEKNIFLNALEVMLMIAADGRYEYNYRMRQVYQYGLNISRSRVGVSGSNLKRLNNSSFFKDTFGIARSDDYQDESAVVDSFSHLTPEAALCMTSIAQLSSWGIFPKQFLEKLNPNVDITVRPYVAAEFKLQLSKMRVANRIAEDIREGKYRGGRTPEPCELVDLGRHYV